MRASAEQLLEMPQQPMDPDLITEARLLTWTGFTTRGHLERWLRRKQIPYSKSVGGQVVTVRAAVERSLIGDGGSSGEIEFED